MPDLLLEAFGWINEPAAWAGLFALVVMEVVLGIDNLVFIAILSERVSPRQRVRARAMGLAMALLLRLALLSAMSWVMTLRQPLLSLGSIAFSGRDFILILGGAFLLFKATTELHERLEGVPRSHEGRRSYARFWTVVFQIMMLDAVFSLDAVITAVGMVDHLAIMMLAVIIAISIMLLAANPLARFVNSHPTVVMLCLCFLLMIGFSLVVEGFGFPVPKGYLYAAIGFSVLIEAFNQVARANYVKHQKTRPLRERTAEAILRLMGEKQRLMAASSGNEEEEEKPLPPEAGAIAGEESSMINGVLSLGNRSLRSLMTPRSEMCWINLNNPSERILATIAQARHSHFPVARGDLDNLLGIARASEMLEAMRQHGNLEHFAKLRPPTLAPESMDSVRLLALMRKAPGHVVLAVDEFGSVSGLITPVDVFEIIAGEFLEDDEKPDIIALKDGRLLVQGHADLHHLEQYLDVERLLPPGADYGTVAGLLLDKLGHLPEAEETLAYQGLKFRVKSVSDRRIEEVLVRRLTPEEDSLAEG
ncbi:MAG: TerC family protein [Deltaproteobacteria bacterium]|jgi:CBS domain containing-hemolysin-like protein|nr:TerC family protein [Deltaproteobacteria bacterium]